MMRTADVASLLILAALFCAAVMLAPAPSRQDGLVNAVAGHAPWIPKDYWPGP